jgi:hypothetical protein
MWSNAKAVKHAKAALALLTAPASKGKKTSKKTSKKASEKSSKKAYEKASQKTKEGAALANALAPELRAEYQANYGKAKSAPETTKKSCEATATKMFISTQICCLWMPSTHGTRKSRSRWRLIHSRIFKACPGKAQGNFCASHLTTALCITFSMCSQTM